MPDNSVRISFEAREELSRAVNEIQRSLNSLKGSLSSTSAAFGAADAAADSLDNELDDIGDEATQASVKLGTLATSLQALAGTKFAGIDIPIDVDKSDIDESGEVAVDKLRQTVLDELDGGDLSERLSEAFGGDFDEDEFRETLKESKLSDRQFDTVDIDNLRRKVKESAEDIEAEEVDIKTDLDDASRAELVASVKSLREEAETFSTIQFDAELKDTALERIPAEARALKELAEGAAGDIDYDVNIDATDDALELLALASSLSEVQSEAIKAAIASSAAANRIDEMGDESRETAGEMGLLTAAANALSLNTTALSLNIGAFNIALGNLATQIPMLVASIGTLVTGLAGLASAALLAATGVSAIFAGGFLAELTRVEEQFDNIESKAEAMQAIMRSLGQAFLQAVSPLTELNGASETFFGIINGLLETTETFSRGIAQSFEFGTAQDGLMSLSEFIDSVGSTWGNNLDDITEATMRMSAELLPIIDDFLSFFIGNFDNLLDFITKFTVELTNSDMRAGLNALLEFSTELISLGSKILQGLLPVFAGLISVGTEVFSMFNALNNSIVRNVAGAVLLTLALSKLYGIGKLVVGSNLAMVASKYALAAATNVLTASVGILNAAFASLGTTIAVALAPITLIVAALVSLVAAGALVVGVLGNMEGVTGGLAGVLGFIKDVLVGIGDYLLTTFIVSWNIIATIIEAVIFQFQRFTDFITSIGFINKALQQTNQNLQEMLDWISKIPRFAREAFDFMAQKLEEFINAMPDAMKSALGIEGEFRFSQPGEGLTVSRSDIISGAEDASSAAPSLSGDTPTNLNYTEQNINNVSQEVNADPEDKATLSRVVKDAMEEADSFTRQRNGFTGN